MCCLGFAWRGSRTTYEPLGSWCAMWARESRVRAWCSFEQRDGVEEAPFSIFSGLSPKLWGVASCVCVCAVRCVCVQVCAVCCLWRVGMGK